MTTARRAGGRLLRAAVALAGVAAATSGTQPHALDAAASTPHAFTITDAPGHRTGLYPGASQPQWVRITNPNHFDILVTSLTATAGSRATGCPAGNLTVVPLRTPVRVRATSYTDTALTARLSPTAPDGCKNLTFPLTYSGTATKP
jgi:hypothetical protein